MTQMGALTDLVANRARYADLVVLPKPYGKGLGPETEAVIEAAMFEGMAPSSWCPKPACARPCRAASCWPGTRVREALVAARRALPFLKAADTVAITVIDPPVHGPERSDPGGPLCQLLVRHGVKAEVQVLARSCLPRSPTSLPGTAATPMPTFWSWAPMAIPASARRSWAGPRATCWNRPRCRSSWRIDPAVPDQSADAQAFRLVVGLAPPPRLMGASCPQTPWGYFPG